MELGRQACPCLPLQTNRVQDESLIESTSSASGPGARRVTDKARVEAVALLSSAATRQRGDVGFEVERWIKTGNMGCMSVPILDPNNNWVLTEWVLALCHHPYNYVYRKDPNSTSSRRLTKMTMRNYRSLSTRIKQSSLMHIQQCRKMFSLRSLSEKQDQRGPFRAAT